MRWSNIYSILLCHKSTNQNKLKIKFVHEFNKDRWCALTLALDFLKTGGDIT